MRFVLAFNGTRGDIQPAVVLGAELRRCGHDLVFGAPLNLVDFAVRARLDARAFGYDSREHTNSELIRDGMKTGGALERLRALLAEIRNHCRNQMVDEMFGLRVGADAAFWLLTKGRENRLRRRFGMEPATKALSQRVAEYGAIEIQPCDALGERALVRAGCSDFEQISSDRLRVVGAVDHERMFARWRTIVHHGGAGTTSAAIRMGKPALVRWVGFDRPFWGRQLERLGLGASTRLKGLGAQELTARLQVVLGEAPSPRARELAPRLIGPEQATRCVDLIEGAAPDEHLSRMSA